MSIGSATKSLSCDGSTLSTTLKTGLLRAGFAPCFAQNDGATQGKQDRQALDCDRGDRRHSTACGPNCS